MIATTAFCVLVHDTFTRICWEALTETESLKDRVVTTVRYWLRLCQRQHPGVERKCRSPGWRPAGDLACKSEPCHAPVPQIPAYAAAQSVRPGPPRGPVLTQPGTYSAAQGQSTPHAARRQPAPPPVPSASQKRGRSNGSRPSPGSPSVKAERGLSQRRVASARPRPRPAPAPTSDPCQHRTQRAPQVPQRLPRLHGCGSCQLRVPLRHHRPSTDCASHPLPGNSRNDAIPPLPASPPGPEPCPDRRDARRTQRYALLATGAAASSRGADTATPGWGDKKRARHPTTAAGGVPRS